MSKNAQAFAADLVEEQEVTFSPMLLESASKPWTHADWLFEPKWCGYRAIVSLSEGRTTLTSRRGTDMMPLFPEIAGIASRVHGESVTLDGEIIVGDGSIASFDLLHKRAKSRRSPFRATLIVWDILELDAHPTIHLPLEERRALLARVVEEEHGIAISRSFDDGVALFQEAGSRGIEGIVAKLRGSPYQPGKRTRSWIKIKTAASRKLRSL